MSNYETRHKLEVKVAKAIIHDLLTAGMTITVNDGEDDVVIRSTNPTEILDSMFTTDEDYFIASKDGREGFVRFIYGNDGWDAAADYSVWLEPYLETYLRFINFYI